MNKLYSKQPGRGFRNRFNDLIPTSTLILLIAAILVGATTAIGAITFIWMLRQLNQLMTVSTAQFGSAASLLALMTAAGLVVGYMVQRWAPEAKGHGVPEVMEAIALKGGRIRPQVSLVKVLASTLTIGTGGSAGREGPIVQTGAALGSSLAQMLRFSAERTRTLVACGAAAGIAATFNAPIAGAIFALEVILGSFTTRYFGTVVISSVTAAITAQIFLGEQPAFAVPAYSFSPAETPFYILLGLFSAVAAVLFIRTIYFSEALFDGWSLHPGFKAGLGLFLTAVLALLLPRGSLVLGPGLEFIGETIAEDFSLSLNLMLILFFGKLLATSFTLGSGNSGGVFAPSLYMGAILGGIVGSIGQNMWPNIVLNPGAYAIVGMAAVFGAAARAPITAVLIVFEMSGDYKLILPLMLATVLATFLAEFLYRDSIYTAKLTIKGITLQRGRDMDLMQTLQVQDAMTRNPYVVLAEMPLKQLDLLFQKTHSHSFPVIDAEKNLCGMVSISDLDRALGRDDFSALHVRDIATMEDILYAFSDEPLSEVVQRLALRGINKMPVVDPGQPLHVVGVVRRRDIVRAYNLALARRAHKHLEEGAEYFSAGRDLEFIEFIVQPDSELVDKTVAQLARRLPHDSVLISIQREGRLLIPHGDTVFVAADRVSCFVRSKDESALRACFSNEAAA